MRKIKYLFAGFLALSMLSCDDYLDINDDPNNIHQEDIRPDMQLPGAMVMTYRVQARSMNILGNIFMQNWYADVNNYTGVNTSDEYTLDISNNFYDDIWDGLYVGVNNFQQVINYDSQDYDNHKAVALIMKSFYMQYIVDLYGDAPYSQAFLGQELLTPAYDNDADIYRALIDNINAGIDLFYTADSNDAVLGSEDVLFQGAINKWIEFANTLKMRILLRQSELTDATTQAYIQDEFDVIATSGVFLSTDAFINPGYSDATDANMNPYNNLFYNSSGSAQTYYNYTRASAYIADFLNGDINGVTDPRGSVLYELVGSSSDIVGAVQGDFNGPSELSHIVPVMPDADSDGILMSYAESRFLLAEAYDKGYLSGDAEMAFYEGVQASFSLYGAGGFSTYYSQIDAIAGLGWNGGNHMEAIMTQKWLATNSVNPIEAYIDMTRTGYPNIPLATTALYSNRPYRLQYPLSEYVANSANVPVIPQAQLFQVGPFWKN
ncbi:hypothetical protein DI487_10720 [Flavobacterium sediminis]|uniref:SusD/RagB family nutrient-binding outer membrane lipoprotein n=1 Tax=Flavobacterium sediminis TaxID=2201181 RepID=A0A2U8QW65_9FLAO|nr:SusD/RagB family nutrient-binding outer membrane lipoprotein [Flavobacterium sediminis]AWM14281.1 hypothetical protein DI487_10720 [Flavobacterium sediminis]